MPGYKNNRRKNYFIDREFQTAFIVKFCLVIISASLVTAVLIYLFNRQTTTVAFEDLRVTVKTTADFIIPIVLEILAIVTLLAGLSTIAVTLFASHKIAGPLYKLKMELEKMKNNDFTSPVRIRSTDQLQKIATNFDELRVHIRDTIRSLKDIGDELSGDDSINDDSAAKSKINELNEKLRNFTV